MQEVMRCRYRGDEGEYIEEFWMEQDEDCPYCNKPLPHTEALTNGLNVTATTTLGELRTTLMHSVQTPLSIWLGMTVLYADVGLVK